MSIEKLENRKSKKKNEKKNDKKILIFMIIGIFILVSVTVGITYAYFVIPTGYKDYQTIITAETDDVGSVALVTGGSLSIKLKRTDMMKAEESIDFYATEDGTPMLTKNIVILGNTIVEGDNLFTCSYTLNIDYEGTMKEKVKHLESVILNLNGTDYDLYNMEFPQKISGSFTYVNRKRQGLIKASLRVVNSLENDQTDLAGTNMTLTFTADTFSCTAIAPPEEVGKYVYVMVPDGLNYLTESSEQGDMYRFQGTNNDVNNYICFGSSECNEDNASDYLYRIIGVTDDYRLKVIKNTSIGNNSWNTTNRNRTWPNSTLFANLNDATFLNNSTYMGTDDTWKGMIETQAWKYGDVTSGLSYDGMTVYELENELVSDESSTAKISLMYIHDYLLAYPDGNPGSSANAKTSWIFNGSSEWTMSRYGYNGGTYYAWRIYGGGTVDINGAVTDQIATRPVFYINANVKRLKGKGTSTEPFIISN